MTSLMDASWHYWWPHRWTHRWKGGKQRHKPDMIVNAVTLVRFSRWLRNCPCELVLSEDRRWLSVTYSKRRNRVTTTFNSSKQNGCDSVQAENHLAINSKSVVRTHAAVRQIMKIKSIFNLHRFWMKGSGVIVVVRHNTWCAADNYKLEVPVRNLKKKLAAGPVPGRHSLFWGKINYS